MLVNAAGVTHYSLLAATQSRVVEEVVGTNLMGTLWGCQVMVKNMMRRKRGILIDSSTCVIILLIADICFLGCIINVSSLLGVKGGKGSAAYAASKAGVIGLVAFKYGRSIADLFRLDTISGCRSRIYEYSSQRYRTRLY